MQYTNKLISNQYSYLNYTNDLRKKFTIRIEVHLRSIDVSDTHRLHREKRNELEKYLKDNIDCVDYHIQRDTGYHGLFYTWFMYKEDAIAFALKFNGKVV